MASTCSELMTVRDMAHVMACLAVCRALPIMECAHSAYTVSVHEHCQHLESCLSRTRARGFAGKLLHVDPCVVDSDICTIRVETPAVVE
jgi:hypothetical protein